MRKMSQPGAGLVKYLSSSARDWSENSGKIVAIFPENTIDGILDEPERLSGVLTDVKLKAFVKRLSENHGMEKILSKLAKYELPSKINFQIYELYKEDTLEVIKDNPINLFLKSKVLALKKQTKLLKTKGFQRQVMHVFRQV
jgi:exodeoxyribonuclease V alpha subunit